MADISTKQVVALSEADSELEVGFISSTEDGRYISYANLVDSGAVDSDGNTVYDQTLYVEDLTTGISTAIATAQAVFPPAFFGGPSQASGIFGGELSANGGYLLYGLNDDLFIKDLESSAPAAEVTVELHEDNTPGSISDDGQEITYAALPQLNIIDPGPDFQGSVVQNVTTGVYTPISDDVSAAGISPDGRYFTYIGLGGNNGNTTIVDLQTNTAVTYDYIGELSDDDRYFLYGGGDEVYLHDSQSSAPDSLVSSNAFGIAANGISDFVSISGDDRHVLFKSTATNLSPGQSAAGEEGLFVKNLDTGSVTLITEIGGSTGLSDELVATISYDGTSVTYQTNTGIAVAQFAAPQIAVTNVGTNDYVGAQQFDDKDVVVSGTSDAIGQTVILSLPADHNSVDMWTAVVQSNGTWSTTIDVSKLGEGVADVHASVTDDYGLTSTADGNFTIDLAPPQLNITSVAGDNYINAAELTHAIVAGTDFIGDPVAGDSLVGELQIKIDNGPTTDFSTQFSPTTDPETFADAIDAAGFADGAHTVTVTAIDEAGNTTVKTIDVTIDTIPPKIAITSVSGDDVVDSSEIKTLQGVEGTSDAIGQTVNVLLDGVVVDQAVVQSDGTWISTVDFSGKATGNHDITAEVSDEAGNPARTDTAVYVDAGFAVTQLSDGPDGEQGGGQGVLFPSLSADGTKLVFTGLDFDLIAPANGSSGAQVYIKDLTTGAITSATPNPSDNSEFGAISQDGTKIVFISNAALDPTSQAMVGDGPGYYTYEENLSDGISHFRAFDSQTPDNLDPVSLIPAGDHLAQPLPVFPLAIANNGYDSELVETTNIGQSGTVDLFENFVLDGSVDANGQATLPYNQLKTFIPAVSSFPGTFQAYAPEFSADGSVVAFEGRFDAEQPTGTQPGPNTQIYAGSTTSNHIALASSSSDGTPMQFGAIDPALSADGNFVAFWSWDNSGAPEVYVKNLATGELKVASSDASGNPGVDNASGTFNAGFNSIAISADGRYVAFTSDANLTPDDSGSGADLYVKDMQTGSIERVPLPEGTLANDLSTQLAMRADGQYIAFTTSAGLSAMDVNQTTDIYGVSLESLGTPPTISLDPVAGDDKINAAEMSKNLVVSGTSDDIGGTVALVVDGNTLSSGVVVGNDGIWSTTIDATHLIDGEHQFRATVTNAAGATGSDGDLVSVDTTPPTVVLSAETTHIAVGQPVTITATFSEAVRLYGTAYFNYSTNFTAQDEGFSNDHTFSTIFTPVPSPFFFAGFEVEVLNDTVIDAAGNYNPGPVELTIGRSFDGYIVGGTVSYANGSGNGTTATTDTEGSFVLSGGTGPLVMTGGTDTSTGLAFTGTFETPDGGTALSPLTTLIEKVIEANPGESVAQATASVDSALGLPAGTDLTSLDAVAGALAGDAASTAAFKAGSELLDVITLIQAAGGSPDAVYAALAADVANGPLDLTNVTTIESIGQSARLDSAAAQAVASIASATDAALAHQLAGATTPLQVFIDITGASIAEQGDASKALSQASGDAGYQQVADSYVQDIAATLSQDDLTATNNVACYCRGTLIETGRGEIPVERLAIGHRVVTASGLLRPIKWIGTRSYGGRFIMGRADILPICFKAGSLGDNLPKRDLWISPHHAMYLEGVLIEARDLVNGFSIVQAERVEQVEYFHIELDSHDVILAEGALSETFVDDDSRGMFHNAHEYGVLYPDTERVAARYCAKRCADGYEVEAARRRIDARAGLRPVVAEAQAPLRGYVDAVSTGCIAGWAQNPEYPEAPVCLDIFAGGWLIGQTLANRFRDDLARADLGSGKHSFEFIPPPGLGFAPWTIEVRRSLDSKLLPRSAQVKQGRSWIAA